MLIKTETRHEKNPLWIYWTPNEVYNNQELSFKHLGFDYKPLIDKWTKVCKIPTKKLWNEIRIKDEASGGIVMPRQLRWWNNRKYMDAVFWVYSTPMKFIVDEAEFYCYALEYIECQRIKRDAVQELGYNPFSSESPSLLVPCDCCHKAWTETSNGYSDHLRPRAEEVVSQQEVDASSEFKEKVEAVKKNIIPLVLEDGKLDELLGGPGRLLDGEVA